MRIARLILSVGVLFSTLASAQWDEDQRCRRRAFDPNERPDMRLVEDGLLENNAVTNRSEKVDKSVLESDVNAHRQLEFTFMLKMYWEEGYCWQLEWTERKWCLHCEGIDCKEDDYLSLDECDVYEDTQWFVYESIDASNREIKLKPWTDQSLCWTRTGDSDLQLKPCGNDYLDDNGRDKQVLIGFKESGEFELHPKGRSDDCLVNDDHFPKWYENIHASDCEEARYFRTSLWEVYEAEQDGGADPKDDDADTDDANDDDADTDDANDDDADNAAYFGKAVNDDDDIPVIEYMGLEYCTTDSPCGLCIGDCNNDEECEGDLICYHRAEYDSVPFCSGGSSDSSRRDYCTYPY